MVLDSFKERIANKFRMSIEDFEREQQAMSLSLKEAKELLDRNNILV